MKTIVVHNQKEFDALPKSFSEYTEIHIERTTEWIYVSEARGNSIVEAKGNSIVEARDNSRIEARGNSKVVAWENSTVVALGNSTVVAWDNSIVEARGNVATYLQSVDAIVTLFMYAVCFVISAGKVIRKSKTATIIKPKSPKGTNGWLISQAIKPTPKVILYKRVSKNFKTQEGTKNETVYKIGSTVKLKNWTPKNNECGEGKLHACSKPYFCDEFRSNIDDKYIAIQIDKKDLYAWSNPQYPHKIAFRRGKVLMEVNRWGEKV